MAAQVWLGEVPAMRPESHFDDGRVVRCFVDRPRSVFALLAHAVQQRPEGEALVDGALRLNWRTLHERCARLAAGLRGHGVQRGDRVLLLLGNRAEFVLALLALARLGAVAVPVSVRSAPPEVAYVAAQCGAMGALCEDDLLGHLPAAGAAPSLRLRVGMAMAAAGGAPLPFAALEAAAPLTDAAAVDEEDTAVILYTSGTTGRPKGAMLTHLNLVHSVLHYQVCMGLTSDDRSVVAVPLSHVTGLVAQALQMVACAGTLVLLDAFKAEAFLRLAAREGITHTVMVPAMYQLCLLQGDFGAHDLRSWRVGAYGGAPMATATISALAEQLPALTLMNCYGATETTSPATVMPPAHGRTRPDSVGVAVPCGELSLRDAAGQPVPAGETGEIWIRGPMVVKGYWNDPVATREAISHGWWRSGDLGRLDEGGFLQVLDRIKDVINRGGYKVFTSEVEAVLVQHPAVAEAAVVGYPCPVLGERVQAFVTLRAAGAADAAALLGHCAARLSDYKVPERWTLATEPLPRNANGKLMKRALRPPA